MLYIYKTLNPETGSIGIIFWMGLSMSAAMSAVGFSEPLLANVGEHSGKFMNILPEGQVNEISSSF